MAQSAAPSCTARPRGRSLFVAPRARWISTSTSRGVSPAGMQADALPLHRAERARLVPDPVGDADSSQIMEQRGDAGARHRLAIFTGGLDQRRHLGGVPERRLDREPRRQIGRQRERTEQFAEPHEALLPHFGGGKRNRARSEPGSHRSLKRTIPLIPPRRMRSPMWCHRIAMATRGRPRAGKHPNSV